MILGPDPYCARIVPASAAGTCSTEKSGAPAILAVPLNDLLPSPVALLMFRPRQKKENVGQGSPQCFPAALTLAAPTVSLAQDARETKIKVDDLTSRTYP